MSSRLVLLFLLSIAFGYPHDLYILPSNFSPAAGERITVFFHNGDQFPESESAPVRQRLKEATLTAGDMSYNITNLREVGKAVVGDTNVKVVGNMILSVRTTPAVLSLPPSQFRTYLKEEGLDTVLASLPPDVAMRERYSKFAKSLIVSGEPDESFQKRLGLSIEIIPEENPYELEGAGDLPILVLWHGDPAPGLQIEVSRAFEDTATETRIVGRTNSSGRLTVKLKGPGKWRIHTVAMEKCADLKVADWESYWASLTFETH